MLGVDLVVAAALVALSAGGLVATLGAAVVLPALGAAGVGAVDGWAAEAGAGVLAAAVVAILGGLGAAGGLVAPVELELRLFLLDWKDRE